MKNQFKNKALFRVLQQKGDKIKSLEMKYWNEYKIQRKKILEIHNFDNDFVDNFPVEQSCSIYACVDGAIIVRHTEHPIPTVEVFPIEMRVGIFKKELPVKNKNGNFYSLGTFLGTHGKDTLTLGHLGLGDAYFDWIHISIVKYDNNNEWEDSLIDIKFYLLGLNSEIELDKSLGNLEQRKTIITELQKLKNDYFSTLKSAKVEEDIQKFLNEHPIIIQQHSLMIPKQKLGEDFITDFVLINTLEQGTNYTFVEIERASLPIFTKNGDFTAEFNHAYNQTLDWDTWLEDNIEYLRKKLTGLEKPKYLIIAGRSDNFDDNHRRKMRAWNRAQKNTEFMTYDDVLYKFQELIDSLQKEL